MKKIPYTVIIADDYSPCCSHTAWVEVEAKISKAMRADIACLRAYEQFAKTNVFGSNAVIDQDITERYPLIGCYEGHLIHQEPSKEWWI